MASTILIAAGGTGGHLFPGIAVADELRRRDPALRIVFAGTARGLESRLVPQAGYSLTLLPIFPLNGIGLRRAALGLLVLPFGLLRAALLVLRLRPQAVLGVGGYAGGPVVLVASLLGVRTVILEPNATPGFTNRALRRFVDRAACAYPDAVAYYGGKGTLTGNPVRRGFTAQASPERQPPLRLLAFGGSQGSRVLNQALLAAIPHLPPDDRLRVVHQTGPAMRDQVAAAWASAGRDVEVVSFLDDMERRFDQADLILARSGATTCAELTAAGKAAVLVPFALAAEDHQRSNANALGAAGAAVVLEEKDLTAEALGRTITELVLNPERLTVMEKAARGLGRPDAAARVADLLLEAPPV
jgi:UDP-N-acetylglucosamine--N-acetylmuramyl-(pentapeptide) pyrophosphoryl-undecaprenol N-acetylglucosamine transferase